MLSEMDAIIAQMDALSLKDSEPPATLSDKDKIKLLIQENKQLKIFIRYLRQHTISKPTKIPKWVF